MSNVKFIIPRTAGDESKFEAIFQKNMPNIVSEVFSVFDEVNAKYTIFQKYNRAIIELINKGVSDKDVWCFCHNDCGILDKDFQTKVDLIFDTTDVAACGVVGASELRETACWWTSPENTLRGHIIQGTPQGEPMQGNHLIKGTIGFYNDTVCFDGLFFMVRAKAIVDSGIRFRADIFSGNHFYDLSLCLDLLMKGYNIAIADLLVFHQSQGAPNNEVVWTAERDKFVNYYKGLGLSFPIDKKTINEWREKNSVSTKETTVQELSTEILEFKL